MHWSRSCLVKGIVLATLVQMSVWFCFWTPLPDDVRVTATNLTHVYLSNKSSEATVQELVVKQPNFYKYVGLKREFPYTQHSVFSSGPIKEVMTHYDAIMDPVPDCPRDRVVVPNIVHWTWFYDKPKTMLFHHYMCALSVVRIQRPERIFLWHDTRPAGQYWDMLVAEINGTGSELYYKQRQAPTTVFGKRISYAEHKSDVARLGILWHYGGIYIDFDVVVLKPLRPLMCFNVTLGQETEYALNNGVITAAPQAQFLQLWYLQYRTYKPDDWDSHNVRVPMQLWKQYPDLIHVEHTTMHQPNWRRKRIQYIYSSKLRYDWSNNYCLHTWHRFFKKEYDLESIMTLQSTLGDMYRYVLNAKNGSRDLMKNQF